MSLAAHHSYKITCYIYCMFPNEIQLNINIDALTQALKESEDHQAVIRGLLDSRAALSNSYPNACMPMQGGSLYHFYDGLWYDLEREPTTYHVRGVHADH